MRSIRKGIIRIELQGITAVASIRKAWEKNKAVRELEIGRELDNSGL